MVVVDDNVDMLSCKTDEVEDMVIQCLDQKRFFKRKTWPLNSHS